jgi:hypothetical protein
MLPRSYDNPLHYTTGFQETPLLGREEYTNPLDLTPIEIQGHMEPVTYPSGVSSVNVLGQGTDILEERRHSTMRPRQLFSQDRQPYTPSELPQQGPSAQRPTPVSSMPSETWTANHAGVNVERQPGQSAAREVYPNQEQRLRLWAEQRNARAPPSTQTGQQSVYYSAPLAETPIPDHLTGYTGSPEREDRHQQLNPYNSHRPQRYQEYDPPRQEFPQSLNSTRMLINRHLAPVSIRYGQRGWSDHRYEQSPEYRNEQPPNYRNERPTDCRNERPSDYRYERPTDYRYEQPTDYRYEQPASFRRQSADHGSKEPSLSQPHEFLMTLDPRQKAEFIQKIMLMSTHRQPPKFIN